MQGLDRAMAVAAQSFTALIPLLMMVSAVAPRSGGDAVPAAIIHRFELEGSAADAVRQVFATSEEASIGLLSFVLLVLSGVSLTRRLQRMYQQIWQLEPVQGVRAQLDATLGLAALIVEITLLYFARKLFGQLPADWAASNLAGWAAGVVVWTSVPWLLLDRRIHWRRLLPGGVLAATCVIVYGAATTVYMPRLMESYSTRYGLFGVTIALVGWLLCIAFIIVTATIVAAEFDRAPEPWAVRLRRRLRIDH
jgi:membrane protein